MAICTSCTHFVPYLYTLYGSESNLRLEKCASCHEFVDPYVEHDSLTILLDLVLLKRGVYRHLLYNRGVEPRRLVGKGVTARSKEKENTCRRDLDIYLTIFQLGTMLLLIDSFIRWSYLYQTNNPGHRPWTSETFSSFARVLLGTSAETIAFHGGTTLSCYILLKLEKAIYKMLSVSLPKSDVRQEFRLSLVPLSLFYSSITKLFLLLLLTIWLPTSKTSHFAQNPLPDWVAKLWRNDTHLLTNTLSILDDDKLDREWVVRNVLGGMSAGFGLRVILDNQPIFTTVIILSGWMAKTAVTTLISQWVGGDKSSGEAWLAYSIP